MDHKSLIITYISKHCYIRNITSHLNEQILFQQNFHQSLKLGKRCYIRNITSHLNRQTLLHQKYYQSLKSANIITSEFSSVTTEKHVDVENKLNTANVSSTFQIFLAIIKQ